jgi:DNA-binding transcriptional MocR family regulator
MNKSDPTDLYEQVAAEIRRAIADGEAKAGERLPPAKDLAAVLGVNTNTRLHPAPHRQAEWRLQSPPVGSRLLLAMQKVEGSSPFIRFTEPAGDGGFFGLDQRISRQALAQRVCGT